jgi:hypothetical protein
LVQQIYGGKARSCARGALRQRQQIQRQLEQLAIVIIPQQLPGRQT